MTGKYLPPKIINFILGMNFSLFSFDFMSLKDIPYYLDIEKFSDFPQEDEYLSEIGLISGSSFINNLRLLITFTIILATQLFTILCK